ncbi:hypothetical protein NPIL_442651 [Nephila pilipes]|uniref:Uncharacterized protein n=1 Tax=Nephila pilipes TaxID=299642 RepID=A0A8X6MA74_NEPPI|nr:hypothetical protein NPIL_442651 [Nephila pilipes]
MNSYEAGVRKAVRRIVTTIHPGLTISPYSQRLLQVVMSQFNDKMIKDCLNKNSNGKRTEMREEIVQKAVEAALPQQLRAYAITNAHRCLANYKAGLFVYEPVLIRFKKKPTTAVRFLRTVQFLAEMINPEIKLSKDAKEMVADILQQMCKSLAEKAESVSEGKAEVAPHEIVKSIDYFMPATIARFAISEGLRNALRSMNGLSYYKRNDFHRKTLRKP